MSDGDEEESRQAGSGRGDESAGSLSPALLSRLGSLIQIIEAEVPDRYRLETYRMLAARVLPAPAPAQLPSPTPAAPPAGPSVGGRAADGSLESSRLDLASYAGVLAAPGRTRLKALVALEAASIQLGVNWMSPAEVERLLVERAGVRSIYRTNISTALSKSRGLVDRRRRGRGYEYRLTALGRETLRRELTLLGD